MTASKSSARMLDAADAAPLHKLRAVNQFFFRDLKFRGNVNNYYDPDNSYVNVVLRTRSAPSN